MKKKPDTSLDKSLDTDNGPNLDTHVDTEVDKSLDRTPIKKTLTRMLYIPLTALALYGCNTSNPLGPGRNYPEQEPRVIESIEFATNPTPDMNELPVPYFSHITTMDNYKTPGTVDTVRVYNNEELISTVTRISHIAGNIKPEQAKEGRNKIVFEAKKRITEDSVLVARDSVYFNKG